MKYLACILVTASFYAFFFSSAYHSYIIDQLPLVHLCLYTYLQAYNIPIPYSYALLTLGFLKS